MFDMIEYVLKEFETLVGDFWRFSVILSGYYFFVEYCVVIRSCPFVFEFFFSELGVYVWSEYVCKWVSSHGVKSRAT